MMHYAETSTCRIAVIRAYFNEPPGDPCLRCDNCLNLSGPAATDTSLLSSRRAAKGSAVVLPSTSPTPSPQPITVLETIHGTLHTTAPETLPVTTPEPSFHPGDPVSHKRFGPGKVLDIHNDMVLVAFPKSGSKRLRADFLQSA